MRKATRTLSPVERAMLVAQWKANAVTGRLHVLLGEDGLKLVGGAGKIMFVVLGGCIADGIGLDDPDVRIVRGAVNALQEQAECQVVDKLRRASIVSGLNACDRLLQRLSQRGLSDSALKMEVMLRNRCVTFTDFEAMVRQLKAASPAVERVPG